MERIMEPGEIYSEKKIAQLLEYATENLEPSTGYKLRLEGVQTDTVTQKELDAFFGATIDHTTGALVDLSYSEKHAGLVLDTVSLPISQTRMIAELRRTEAGIYIPLINSPDSAYPLNQHYMTEGAVEHFLERFGLQDIPRNDAQGYRLWQSSILDKTRAWNLTEATEIPLAVTDSDVEAVTLSKNTIVNQDTGDILTNITLTERIVAFYPEHDQKDFSDSTIELITTAHSQTLRHYISSYTETYDPFAVNHTDTKQSHIQDVAICEENFDAITKRVRRVIELQQASKQL